MINVDIAELVKRVIKYMIEGLAVSVAAYFIPKRKMVIWEIVMIAVSAASTFAVLDFMAPAISAAARHGAGFGIGINLAGAKMPVGF